MLLTNVSVGSIGIDGMCGVAVAAVIVAASVGMWGRRGVSNV